MAARPLRRRMARLKGEAGRIRMGGACRIFTGKQGVMMKKTARLLSLAFLILLLGACRPKYVTASSEEGAIAYYRAKYGETVAVREAHGLGNYSLFYYVYGGYEYIMEDGVSVIYLDGDGDYSDNRQTSEIEEAALSFAGTLLRDTIRGNLTPVEAVTIGWPVPFETYRGEGNCYRTFFDGDIEAFLRKERPALRLAPCPVKDRYYADVFYESGAEDVEGQWEKISGYFDIDGTVVSVVERGYFDEAKDAGLSAYEPGHLYAVKFDTEDGRFRARKKVIRFVEATEGLWVDSEVFGVELRDGDVRLEPAGDGAYELSFADGIDQRLLEGSFTVRNETEKDFYANRETDVYTPVCAAYETREYRSLAPGRYYFGDIREAAPSVEVTDITPEGARVIYRSRHLSEIDRVELRVIAMKKNGTVWTSAEIKTKKVSQTADALEYRMIFDKDVKPTDNSFSFQFTYTENGKKDESPRVILKKNLDLARGTATDE